MIGSFLTRGLVMVFGYAYPAYECYKKVEKNKPEIEQLRFWCQYWILVAVLTVFEKFGDALISWVPMYSEAKLAFFVYLWYPKTMGTTYVYNSLFKPYVSKHENEIDRNLLELKARAGDMAVLYFQRATSFGQTRILEILQYVAAQSTPKPQPPQKQQPQQKEVPKTRKAPNTPIAQPPTKPKPQPKEPPSPATTPSLTKNLTETKEEKLVPSPIKPTSPSSPLATLAKAISAPEKSLQSAPTETEAAKVEPVPPEPGKETSAQALKETIMEETIRLTRGRLRKARSAGTR